MNAESPRLLDRPLLWLAVAAAIGIGAGWWRPLPALPAAAHSTDKPWALPDADALVRFRETDYLALRRSPLWHATEGEGEGEASQAWQFAGVLHEPEGLVALLVYDDARDRPHRIRVGDRLADGSEVLALTPDAMTTSKDGCRRTFTLFSSRRESPPRCADDAPTANDGNPQ